MRYTRQHHDDDCVSALLANIVKWSGTKFSYRTHKKVLMELLEINVHGGTHYKIFNNFLLAHILPFKVIKCVDNPKISLLKKHLAKGGAIALWYNNDVDQYHTCLIDKYENKRFNLINFNRRSIFKTLTDKKFKQLTSMGYMALLVEKEV